MECHRSILPSDTCDSLGDWIEVPLLGKSVLNILLDYDSGCSNRFNNSGGWKFGYEVELLVGSHAEVSVVCTDLMLDDLVFIDDSPLLVTSSMFLPSINLVSFFILSSLNVKYLLVLDIFEEFAIESPDLVPDG